MELARVLVFPKGKGGKRKFRPLSRLERRKKKSIVLFILREKRKGRNRMNYIHPWRKQRKERKEGERVLPRKGRGVGGGSLKKRRR